MSERPQRTDDVFDFILLKQTDASDAGRSGVQTCSGVSQVDAAESEDGNVGLAGFPQGSEASRVYFESVTFSKDRGKDDKVGFVGFGAEDIGDRVAGGGHEKMVSVRPVHRACQYAADFMRGDVVCPEMNAVSPSSQRDINAGIHQKAGRCRMGAHDGNRLARQSF